MTTVIQPNTDLSDLLLSRYRMGAVGPCEYDCFTAAAEILRRVDRFMPSRQLMAVAAAKGIYLFERLPGPEPWALILFDVMPHHVGVVTADPTRFFHICSQSGPSIERLNKHPWRTKVRGCYRPLHFALPAGRQPLEPGLWYVPNPFEPHEVLRCGFLAKGTVADFAAASPEPVEVVVNGEWIEPSRWAEFPIAAGDCMVMVPSLGAGRDMFRMVAMVAVTILAPYIGAALGVPAGYVMMAGALLVSAGIPAATPDSPPAESWGFNPVTTQRLGDPVPESYGAAAKVTGNVIACWTEELNTTRSIFDAEAYMIMMGDRNRRWRGVPMGIFDWIRYHPTFTLIEDSREKITMVIDCGRGPVDGFVAGSMRINGSPVADFPGVTVTTRRGLMEQTALFSQTERQLRPWLTVTHSAARIYTTPDADFDNLKITLVFENGLYTLNSDDNRNPDCCDIVIEIAVAGSGSWSTLFDDAVIGKANKPLYITYDCAETYVGGSPVTIVRGNQYDIRVTKGTADGNGWDIVNALRLGDVKEVLDVAFEYPGHVLVGVTGMATKEFNGTIEFEAQVEGRIVPIWNGSAWTLAQTENPVWNAVGTLTDPVISGDGTGPDPYTLARCDGVDVARLANYIDRWKAWADWCDELVSDGKGSTEARFTYNLTSIEASTRWDAVLQIASLARGSIVRCGRDFGCWYDAAANPVYCLCARNIAKDGYEEVPIPADKRANTLVGAYIDRITGQREAITAVDRTIDSAAEETIDCRGFDSPSRVSRHLLYQLAKNRYLNATVHQRALPDALTVESGDVVYQQHPIWDWSDGFRVLAADADSVTLDQTPEAGHTFAQLIVKTVESGVEYVDAYSIASVLGSVVHITGTFTHPVAAGDLVIAGPADVLTKLVRVLDFGRRPDGSVDLVAIDYDARVYAAEADATFSTDQRVSTPQSTTSLIVTPEPNATFVNGDQDLTDAVQVHGGYFYADGTKICWSAFTVTVSGTSYTIAANAAGTTDDFVYWDSTSPNAFQSTTDAADFAGVATAALLARNDGGVITSVMGQVQQHGATIADGTLDTPQIADEATHAGGEALSTSELTLTTSYQDVPGATVTITSDGTMTECTCFGEFHNTGISGHSCWLRIINQTASDVITALEYVVAAGTTFKANFWTSTDLPAVGAIEYRLQAKADVGSATCHLHIGAPLMIKQWKGK